MSEIESEVNARTQLAAKLQADVTTYKHLVELDRDKVEAVVQALRGEVSKGSRSSLLYTALFGFVFFLLGALANNLFH
jgi:hypothetical protein